MARPAFERQDADVGGGILLAVLLLSEPKPGERREIEHRFGFPGDGRRRYPRITHQGVDLGDRFPRLSGHEAALGQLKPGSQRSRADLAGERRLEDLGALPAEKRIGERVGAGLGVDGGKGIRHPGGAVAGRGAGWRLTAAQRTGQQGSEQERAVRAHQTSRTAAATAPTARSTSARVL